MAVALIKADGGRIGQIEASHPSPDGNADMVWVAGPEPIGKAGGFRTKDQDLVSLHGERKKRSSLPGAGEQDVAGDRLGLNKCLPVGPHMDINMGPVVKPGSFEVLVFQAEAQRLYKVQRSLGGGAKTGNSTGVRWYLRLKKNNLHSVLAKSAWVIGMGRA